jgi:hypothetical protein
MYAASVNSMLSLHVLVCHPCRALCSFLIARLATTHKRPAAVVTGGRLVPQRMPKSELVCSFCLSLSVSRSLSVSLSVCLSRSLGLSQSLCLSVSLGRSRSLSVALGRSRSLSVALVSRSISVSRSLGLSVSLSLCLSVSLSL